MTEFSFGPYRLRIDVEATRAYYAALPRPQITCTCTGCRNFAAAISSAPKAVLDFLDTLGLDALCPGELCFYPSSPAAVHGGGWYHLVGELCQAEKSLYPLADGFSVWFQEECYLLPKDFPRPAIQMEFNHSLPWVLDEEFAAP